MSLLVLVAVGTCGGLGALARFALDAAVAGRLGRGFPYGTLVVNLGGTFALGVLVGAALDGDLLRIAAAGLLGSFTTFSTWALESHRLGEDGHPRLAALNVAVSLAAGIAAVWAGRALGGML